MKTWWFLDSKLLKFGLLAVTLWNLCDTNGQYNYSNNPSSTCLAKYCLSCAILVLFFGNSQEGACPNLWKSESTIGYWITKYEENGVYKRKQRKLVYKKFSATVREWLVDLYRREPVLFLDEARQKFYKRFFIAISVSSICLILHGAGMTWKCIERRAMQIRDDEITRFVRELLSVPWDLSNLVFLDEVSFDNRDMLRRKGYGIVG